MRKRTAFFEKHFLTPVQYQQVAYLFCLGIVKRISFFDTHGFESSKAILKTTTGSFVVSLYKVPVKGDAVGKSKASIQYEIDLTRTLKDLPVPEYLPSRHEQYIEREFGFHITVYKFLNGKPPKIITSRKAYQLGVFLGEFHHQGRKFLSPLRGRRKFYILSHAVLRKMDVHARQQTHPLLGTVVNEIRSGVEKYYLPRDVKLPVGPVHVDVKPENELFIKDRLTGILDFGIFYRDYFLVDIGKTIMWNCSKQGKIDQQLFHSFIRGYCSKRRLVLQEKAYLKQAILFGIFAHIYVDLYHVPLQRVPEEYTLFLVKNFLPIARWLERNKLPII